MTTTIKKTKIKSIRTKEKIEEIKVAIIRTSATTKNKKTPYTLTELTNISMKTNRINIMKTIKGNITDRGKGQIEIGNM